MGVLDVHPTLLGAVDEEESAQAPERLATEGLLALLVDEHRPPPGVGDLGGGGQAGQAGAHDDDIGVPRGVRLHVGIVLTGPCPGQDIRSPW